jgi:hypothetical protein
LTGGRWFQVVPELPVNQPETPILIGLVRKTAVDADAKVRWDRKKRLTTTTGVSKIERFP